eukprot:324234-Amphidinium_carterae.1
MDLAGCLGLVEGYFLTRTAIKQRLAAFSMPLFAFLGQRFYGKLHLVATRRCCFLRLAQDRQLEAVRGGNQRRKIPRNS